MTENEQSFSRRTMKLFSSIAAAVGSSLLVATTEAKLGEKVSNNKHEERSLAVDTYIFQNVQDGYAQLTTSNASEKEGTPCTAGRTVK